MLQVCKYTTIMSTKLQPCLQNYKHLQSNMVMETQPESFTTNQSPNLIWGDTTFMQLGHRLFFPPFF